MNAPCIPNEYPAFVDALTVNRKSGTDGLIHAAIGMSGESGEVLDMIKKTWVFNKPLDISKLKYELGDLLFYLQFMCNNLGVTLQEIAEMNISKLTARYPTGYSDAAAISRKDGIT